MRTLVDGGVCSGWIVSILPVVCKNLLYLCYVSIVFLVAWYCALLMLSLMLSLPVFPSFTIDCFDFDQIRMVWQCWKYKWSEKGSKNANFKSFSVGLHSQRWNVWDHWVMLCSKMLSRKGKPASSSSPSSYLCPSRDVYYPHVLKLCVFSPYMLYASLHCGKSIFAVSCVANRGASCAHIPGR